LALLRLNASALAAQKQGVKSGIGYMRTRADLGNPRFQLYVAILRLFIIIFIYLFVTFVYLFLNFNSTAKACK
jgi:heme/copper-type cytochrome/quinol oxidase subunit 2